MITPNRQCLRPFSGLQQEGIRIANESPADRRSLPDFSVAKTSNQEYICVVDAGTVVTPRSTFSVKFKGELTQQVPAFDLYVKV